MSERLAAVHPAAEPDPDVWRSVAIDEVADRQDEPLGTKIKFWVRRSQDPRPWLFKFATIEKDTGRVLGEDWAEWVVHKIAQQFGVPSATILPATAAGRRGILSRSILDVERGESLTLGNEVLADLNPRYDATSRGYNSDYTLQAVRSALEPLGSVAEAVDLSPMIGFELFTGYLVLDALVAGQDRHHENWAVTRSGASRFLAPTFDHGNALGFNATQDQLSRALISPAATETWVKRGRSRHFSGKPRLVALAHAALNLSSDASRKYWREHLEGFNPQQVTTTLASIPTEVMSEDSRSLALLVVTENRRRLLNDYPA